VFDDASNKNTVLRSETALTDDQSEQVPVGRDHEIHRIADAVRPLTDGQNPANLLVYGPPGVGKTLCIKHVFHKLEEQTSVKPIYINCWQYNTRPSLLTQLLIEVGYPAPRKGKPVDALLSRLREWMDKQQGLNRPRGFAIALDEFDQLQDKTEVIYDLLTVNRELETNLGLMMVSNRHPSQLQLDSRSQSRLNCQTLGIQPYSTTELEDVLQDRIEQAFRPDAVTDTAVAKVAETVAESNGDCRQALGLLLQAGQYAERENRDKVTADVITEILQD